MLYRVYLSIISLYWYSLSEKIGNLVKIQAMLTVFSQIYMSCRTPHMYTQILSKYQGHGLWHILFKLHLDLNSEESQSTKILYQGDVSPIYLMYIINNRGPRTDNWGTTVDPNTYEDDETIFTTFCGTKCSYFLKHLCILSNTITINFVIQTFVPNFIECFSGNNKTNQ